MNPAWISLAITVVGLVFTVGVTYGVMRTQLQAAGDKAAAAVKAAQDGAAAAIKAAEDEACELRRTVSALHKRCDAFAVQITAVERDTAHHGKELERSLARIEGAMGSMASNIQGQLSAISSRLDALARGN